MMTRPRKTTLQLLVLVAGVGFAVLVVALPALAGLTGGCTAAVTIDGVSYGPANDTAGNPIVVPDRSDVTAQWQGAVPFANDNYMGEVGLVVGPATINLRRWGPGSGANSTTGTYTLQELRSVLPGGVKLRGVYELTGFHQTSSGRCEGRAMVRFGGSPLDSAVGIAALAGLGLSGVGLLGAAFHKGA